MKYNSISDIKHYSSALITDNCGWHLNYFGNADFIINKIKSKDNKQNHHINKKSIEASIKSGKHIFNNDINITFADSHNYFPRHYYKLNHINNVYFLNNKMGVIYNIYNNLLNIYKKDLLPKEHVDFLIKLRDEYNFNPSVCYDIGSCVLHWTRHAHTVWPNSKIILFDAFERVKIFYENYDYYLGVLSNNDDKEIDFYQHDMLFGGNSYYKENTFIFDNSNIIVKKTKTLDTVVNQQQFPYPDLIKIDVQGAELDILIGSNKVLSFCKYLIVELQDVHYNEGAPLAEKTIDYLKNKGWECIARKFSDNGPDGDYCFVNTNLVQINNSSSNMVSDSNNSNIVSNFNKSNSNSNNSTSNMVSDSSNSNFNNSKVVSEFNSNTINTLDSNSFWNKLY
jgi:FkbM family methyltransferase